MATLTTMLKRLENFGYERGKEGGEMGWVFCVCEIYKKELFIRQRT
jgi:hypothetical protein